MNEDNVVYLLYEGDAWLSSDSLVLMGIFTDKEQLKQGAIQLAEQHIVDLFDLDDGDYEDMTEEEAQNAFIDSFIGELMNNSQTQGYEVNFDIKAVELNKVEEI